MLLSCGHGLFESFPNEACIGDTAHFRPSLYCFEQLLRHAHVDLLVFPLEFKPCGLKLRKIQAGEILSQKRLSLSIRFKARNFFSYAAISLACINRAVTGRIRRRYIFVRIAKATNIGLPRWFFPRRLSGLRPPSVLDRAQRVGRAQTSSQAPQSKRHAFALGSIALIPIESADSQIHHSARLYNCIYITRVYDN